MTILKTTLSPTTGHTLTECFELGYLKVVPTGIPFQGDKKAHQFASCGWLGLGYKCLRCSRREMNIEGKLRDGCHLFSKLKSNPSWYCSEEYDGTDIKRVEIYEEYVITGCNIHDRSEWVRYPATGKAWQQDKFINEQVIKDNKKYAGKAQV